MISLAIKRDAARTKKNSIANRPGNLKEASKNEDVMKAYKSRGEEIVPLGVSGTTVAVDWDSCGRWCVH